MEEQIHGLTMRDCAEIIAQLTELKTQHGERDFKPHFEQYLGSRNTSEAQYSQSWNAWWTRINADPSGQLQAQHAMIQSALVRQAHTSDLANMGQETMGGLPLETFALVSAKVDAGEDVQTAIAAAGLDSGAWETGSTAWRTAIAERSDAPVIKQFNYLYAKHNPIFQKLAQGEKKARREIERIESTEGARQRSDELVDLVRELAHELPSRRWDASYDLAHKWDFSQGDARHAPEMHDAMTQAAKVMNNCLSDFDSVSISSGTRAAKNLAMLAKEGFFSPEQAADAKGNITRCLNRAKESLTTLKTAFASISDQKVPERIPMQQQIQDYTTMVEDLEVFLRKWDGQTKTPAGNAPSAAPSGASSVKTGNTSNAMTGAEMAAMHRARRDAKPKGVMGFLQSLPLVGWIFKILG